MKSRVLIATIWIMVAFTVLTSAVVDWRRSPEPALVALVLVVFTGVASNVIVSYWSGKNWARQLVLATSIVVLNDIAHWHNTTWTVTSFRIAQAGFAIFLLFWLNGKEARAHFGALYQERTPAQTVS